MKFVIAVDFEGLACVVGSPGVILNESRNYAFSRVEAVRETNAAAKALFDVGAEQVIVWDNHNGSLNMDYDLLDERVDIALGIGFPRRFPGMDETFNGVLFIGYHPKDNTEDAVIAHTLSSRSFQWIKVNGVEVGEIELEAAVAGEMGVPVIFVASDDKGVAEAKQFLPWVETVTTKKGFGWNAAISKHPRKVEREIYEGVKRAVERLSEMKPFQFSSPVNIQIRYKRLEAAESVTRGATVWRRVDAYIVEATFERISDWL